ncbi:hypothetical protein RBSWK_02329 [Rhodopirellula baltica SWK14]|uniref:Uncharacterized protein n=1 Tax=Rhodopirellula baltica SWK14 TaxID=993516 RepID=L7CID2_RHOBT|nr:hypothetical protein RBSWK_02329 [Rhodopirellula baltica SWK14]
MKVVETSAFRMKTIKVWCLQKRMTVATEIAITLIVGHHQNDVWRRHLIEIITVISSSHPAARYKEK